jgi:hypothetical protein
MREPFRSFRLQLRIEQVFFPRLDPNDISISRFDCLEEETAGRMNNHHLGLQRIPFNSIDLGGSPIPLAWLVTYWLLILRDGFRLEGRLFSP